MGGKVRARRYGALLIRGIGRIKPLVLIVALLGATGWSAQPAIDAALAAISPQAKPIAGRVRTIRDHLFGIDMVSPTHGVAVGYYGTVLSTANGGHDWTPHRTGANELLRRVHAVSETEIWAVGHRGSIFHSADGGGTWDRTREPDGVYLRDIAFVDPRTGWAVGHDAKILRTSDGGKSWVEQELVGYTGRDLPRLHGIVALDRQTAVLAGEFGTVAVTRDGGQTWRLVETPVETTLTALSATHAMAVAVGLDGVALTVQLGENPTADLLPTGTAEHLFDVALDAQGQGGAVGRSALLIFDGTRFFPAKADASLQLDFAWYHGADILPSGEIVAVGINGSIIRFDPQTPAQMMVDAPALPSTHLADRGDAVSGGTP